MLDMRGLITIALAAMAVTPAWAGKGSLEDLKASASITADASGKLLGEAFDIPASTSRSASSNLDENPLADAISIAPDLTLVSGAAGASYSTFVSDHEIGAAARATISAKARKSEERPSDLLLTTASSLTFTFALAHTVAADLSVAHSSEEGFSRVRTTLSGPAIQPLVDMEDSGEVSRSLILPPGSYRLTFTHLTAAGVETDEAEPEDEAKGSASFKLAVDPCGADCNGDNTLDILDFICFQQKIEDRAQKADMNNDGKFDILDMIVFQDLFVSGCDR